MGKDSNLSKIKLLVTDVDGVMTDGSIIYSSNNSELKAFNIKDGLGIRLAGLIGFHVVILTGRKSEAVTRRAAELGIEVVQGQNDKSVGIRQITEKLGLTYDEVAYIGDDLNDLPAMHLAGYIFAPADSVEEIIEIANCVTEAKGGRGAVREAIEKILKSQNKWEEGKKKFTEFCAR
jgi:3-deoxy-D-manno-octulosonate 8-phosphate phosphatase (KDO 8-P phosphatase)